MSSTVLIADASIPFAVSLAGALRGKDASVAILASAVQEGSTLDLFWNRPSPLSARTVMLDAKNRFDSLDCAVLAFDVASIPASCREGDSASITHLFDEYVRGYALLISEIVVAFRRQKKGLLCFVLVNRESATGGQSSSVLSSSAAGPAQSAIQATGLSPDIACAMAESAFVKLAEELSSSFAAAPADGIQCLLAKVDPADEATALDWLASQIVNPSASRKENRWVKPGAKGFFAKLS